MDHFLEERLVPRTMSTQHPDNAHIPQWSMSDVINGEMEIHEAFFVYSELQCQEVMWDAEGKDVDTRVIRKLLTKYEDYFKEHLIGRDIFLTYRIPNPRVETIERKIIVETLQNIPVAYDVSSMFYKNDIPPLFEVILPLTTSGTELIWLYNYYRKAIVGAEDLELNGSSRVKDWIGPIMPKRIQIIPLVEDFGSLLSIDKIINSYIDSVKPRYLRVFIARSDPALNYGLFSAVLLSKIALSKLKMLSINLGIDIHPILGVGSIPFRGHLSLENLEGFLNEYRGVSTVTIQSSIRYDQPIEEARKIVNTLNNILPNGELNSIDQHDENILLKILNKGRMLYESIIEDIAPLVVSVSSYVPQRRARKLHIGLFGYSRNVAGATLPRAIPFTAALYSIGIPPEIIGGRLLIELNEEEWKIIDKYYANMNNDFRTIGGYLSWQNVNMIMDMYAKVAERAGMSSEKLENALIKLLDDIRALETSLHIKLGSKNLTQRKHDNFVNNFLISYLEHDDFEARNYFLEAAKLRRCIG
ncbi:phosphoenolpyruvate carboxylase [[Eubacterium] cellulosolvens]